jgi:hypothetical protein
MLATVKQLETAPARRTLRGQIARLERELADTLASSYPPIAVAGRAGLYHGGPRLLGLEELERTRDALAARVSDVHRLLADQRERQKQARARLADMYANPAEHKGERVTNAELGLPGCTTYSVRPRLLSTWWRVKVSSGCP